ncbi:calcium-activated potassium channel subunit beta-2 isoform X3 [Hypomesus transpacificus]|uniref:calcium-activated potassium channel subunit beta-2 isoform X3 n=1 Tax=Hypomesus transpacificus TaxID=137520 RepID=UPI001F0782B5|nr:calcium-activated potassium channel subunit beta-2 isoform X3 [Hypomesus transpacificus]
MRVILTKRFCRSFQQSFRTSSVRKGGRGESGKMFFVAGAKSGGGSGGERRSIYQKIREVDVLDKKKTVTALSAGEDRAMFLGLGMILSSVMMYFVLCITVLRAYADSVWTEESVCIVLNSTIVADVNCSYSCGSDCWRASKYPCLQIYVSVNNTGRVSLLSHNEETQEANSEVHSLDTLPALIAVFLCAQVPKGQLSHARHDREHLRALEGAPAGPLLL